jgi:hypothetical protein
MGNEKIGFVQKSPSGPPAGAWLKKFQGQQYF